MVKTKLYQGKGGSISYTIVDTQGITDFSTYTGTFRIYKKANASLEEFFLEKEIESIVQKNDAWKITVKLEDDDLDILPNIYYFDINFVSGSETPSPAVLVTGIVEIFDNDIAFVQEIKEVYGLDHKESVLKSALDWARKQIRNRIYEKVKITNTQIGDGKKYFLDNYLLDSTFSGFTSIKDINIYQYEDKDDYLVQDLNSAITGLIIDHPMGKTILTMDAAYPSGNYTQLVIEFFKGKKSMQDLHESIKVLQEMYVLTRILNSLDMNKLQRGNPIRTVNGISLDFDYNTMVTFKQSIAKNIYYLAKDIVGFNFKPVTVGKGYDGSTPFDQRWSS